MQVSRFDGIHRCASEIFASCRCSAISRTHRKRSMLNWIIDFSLRHRLLVIVGVLGLAAVGGLSLRYLDIDAFPDTTPVQVQINTVAPSLGPEEVEQRITFPIEQAIGGLPGPRRHAERLEVWVFASGGDVQRRDRHLLRPPAGQRAAVDGRTEQRNRTAEDGARFHRAWRGVALRRHRRGQRRHRAAHDPRLDHQAQDAHREGRRGNQQLGRLRKAVPGADRSEPADQVQPDVRRGGEGRRGEQSQRRRRQYSRRHAVGAGAGAGPHDEYRADQSDRDRGPAWRADSRERRGRGGDRLGDSPRRGDGRRQGRSRDGPGLHADGREHARSHVGDEGSARRDQSHAAGECQGGNRLRPHGAGRSRHQHGEEQPVRRRAARHRGAVCVSRQSAGGDDRGGGDSAVDAVCVCRHVSVRHRGQLAELGGDRLRHDRR